MRLFVTLALVAGCDSLWGITRIDPASDARASDSAPIAAACQPQIIHDDFTGTQLCDHWGIPSGSQATEGGGMLVIAPASNVGGSQGGCFSAAPLAFGDDGVFIKVVSVLAQTGNGTGGSYMFFKTDSPMPADAATLQISEGGNRIQAATETMMLGSAAYDITQPAWWRIRPDHELPGIVADMSLDGHSWHTIGSTSGPIPTSVNVEFTAGEYGAGVLDPGMAVIEDFNVCPP